MTFLKIWFSTEHDVFWIYITEKVFVVVVVLLLMNFQFEKWKQWKGNTSSSVFYIVLVVFFMEFNVWHFWWILGVLRCLDQFFMFSLVVFVDW